MGLEDPLEKRKVTHSSILAWRIPWTEEPGRLLFMGSQESQHDLVTNHHQYSCLENPMDRGAWRVTEHGVTKELDMT